ncbi:MAG: preprotein translocase subunit SecG [Caulobacterales bacterium]|nr:preprotein translocase subunit SecG [Caulobacterales bacterium]
MLLNILLTIQIIVAALLGVTVLLQRSEGGALGMGGGPSGFMTARGQGDLLTRSTWVLFSVFLVLCIALTILQGQQRQGDAGPGRGDIERINPVPLAPAPALPDSGGAAPAPQLRGLPAPTTGSAVDGALGGVAPAQTVPAPATK